jgi:hypothetical protein
MSDGLEIVASITNTSCPSAVIFSVTAKDCSIAFCSHKGGISPSGPSPSPANALDMDVITRMDVSKIEVIKKVIVLFVFVIA